MKSRRKFIKNLSLGAAATIGAPNILSSKNTHQTYLKSNKKVSWNDHIQIAVIGPGGMGMADTTTALSVPGVKLVGACDLYEPRLNNVRKKWGEDLFFTRDYRELLARPDIDAVIIATPDFWHKELSVAALRSGKAVYVEKPMVHNIGEGHAVINAQKETGKTLQVGSQGMSSLGNEKAKELFEAGAIGTLNYAEGFWARNSPGGAWQYWVPKECSPEEVMWEHWLSNTTKRDFDPLRFFRWRNYRDYGTGVSGDLFVHLFSSLHYIVGSKGPNKIMATGGLRHWKDGREVPDVLLGMFDYPDTPSHPAFNLSLRVNFVDGTSGSTFLRLVGSEGAMDVTWNDVYLKQNKSHPAFDDPLSKVEKHPFGKRKDIRPPEEIHYKVEEGYKGAHYDHFVNFFTGVRNGEMVNEDAVFGYRAAAPAILCNDSYFDEKVIRWDPEAMKIIK